MLRKHSSEVDDKEQDSGDDDEEEEILDLGSSEESLSPDSVAPSSLSTIRSRLFASDDEDEEDDEFDREGDAGSAFSSWSGLSPSSCFSAFASPPQPPRRASLSSIAATSDPLRHSLTPPPTLEFDHVRQRGHWLPAPAVPTSETAWSAPDVPDVVRSSLATAPACMTPPPSPPRSTSSVSPTRPESLLTKSLRSLSRLPNLTLADVLPRAASSSSNSTIAVDEDLAALPPGWGPAERRRVLAEEPSHAADEARAGFRYLLRRPPSPFASAARRLSGSSSIGSRKSQVDFGAGNEHHPIDAVEALGYGFGFGLQDLGAGAQPHGSSIAEEEAEQLRVEAPTSTSADVPPLPPRPHEKRQALVVVPSAAVPEPTLASPGEVPATPATVPSPPSSLPPRFISNHRHLLMLSLEFEMMRHAKIRGPLRQRAVIVRQGTSPPREQGARRERSRLSAKQGLALIKEGNIGEKPRSSISALIDILCTERYDEDSLDGIAEIVDSINLQPTTGSTEASRAIRKKLKYSNVHGQLRALTILKVLVENCGPRFESTFADERLVERIKVIAGDPHTDPRVKKKNMQVLGSWYIQFKDDPRMKTVAGLYKACGGGSAGAAGKQTSRSDATAAYEAQQERYEREAALRAERKAAERRAREAAEERAAQEKLEKARRKEAERARAAGGKVKRPKFNFELEKPKIMATVGTGTQAAQALVNALQHVNREKESVTTNARVQECLEKAKLTRKQLIRYIQLIDQDADGDYIGTLIATNEQIIAAVQMYDRMSKPVELDSDDEAVEEAKRAAEQQGLAMPASATPQHGHQQSRSPTGAGANDDTQSIRSALSNFDLQDREVDKLQLQQRRRLHRHLSARAAPPAVHPDLQDLAFGPSGSSSLPPPIQPHSAEDTYRHGSLSDFSDYSSDDGEEVGYHPAPDSHGATPARSYAAYVREEDHRASSGAGAQQAEEEDPFADPFADSNAGDYEVLTPGISDKRMEWKEV
ncbi:hypothetical protein JCM10908_003821 [Rhodotorula pacifica]|uniref:Lsb5p n=1 Tax=Rhodotorula pacifica TaxID=1495444 RepID=UPI00317A798B